MTKFPSERVCMEAIGRSRNMLIPWYLIASYAYYVLDRPVLSDATYDAICVMLDEEWDDLEHMHKWWIDRDDLSAGTRLSTRYPSMAMASACHWAEVRYVPRPLLVEALTDLTEALRDYRCD